MRSIFFDAGGRLRNGWWMLAFIGFVALTRLAYGPVTRGIKQLGVAEAWLEPAAFLFLLLATWACTRLRREPLSSIGFRLDRRWWLESVAGVALGVGSMLVVAGLIWAIGGVRFDLDPARSLAKLGYGLYFFLFVALFEETLFRGFRKRPATTPSQLCLK